MDAVLRHPGDARVTTIASRRGRPGRVRGLDLRRRPRPDLLERPPPRHPAPDPEPTARARRPRLPGTVQGLRADHAAAGRDAARHVRPPGRVLPERPVDRPLHGDRHGHRRPGARRSCSSATIRGRPSWPATGPTSTSRSRSIARPGSSCASSRPIGGVGHPRRRGRRTPARRAPARDRLRLRLPDRDDDALLTGPSRRHDEPAGRCRRARPACGRRSPATASDDLEVALDRGELFGGALDPAAP